MAPTSEYCPVAYLGLPENSGAFLVTTHPTIVLMPFRSSPPSISHSRSLCPAISCLPSAQCLFSKASYLVKPPDNSSTQSLHSPQPQQTYSFRAGSQQVWCGLTIFSAQF